MLVLHGKNINDIPDETDHNYIKIHSKKLEITNGILVVVFFEWRKTDFLHSLYSSVFYKIFTVSMCYFYNRKVILIIFTKSLSFFCSRIWPHKFNSIKTESQESSENVVILQYLFSSLYLHRKKVGEEVGGEKKNRNKLSEYVAERTKA